MAKKNINTLTSKDQAMLKAFANCGYLNQSQLKSALSQTDKRITNFQKDRYIEKVSYLNKDTKNMEQAYRLTDKGKDLCQKQLAIDSFYKSSSPSHDLALANRYLDSPNSNWITENQCRERLQEHIEQLKTTNIVQAYDLQERLNNRQISPPDGAYMTESGQWVAVEVVTSSYRQEDIQAKMEYVRIMSMIYTQTKA